MMWPGSLWYNCIYWSRFETLTAINVLLFHTWSLFVLLAWKQTVTVILLPAPPPFLWRSFVVLSIYKVWGVTPCGAVTCALRLPSSFWHCLCLAILFICLNLVRSSPKDSANTLVLTHGSGTISESGITGQKSKQLPQAWTVVYLLLPSFIFSSTNHQCSF